MRRAEFHKYFKSPGPAVLPVVHVLDNTQAERNVRLAIECGAAGVFLINHDFGVELFLPIVRHVRERFPSLWMGLNFLAVTGLDAFPVLGELEREACPMSMPMPLRRQKHWQSRSRASIPVGGVFTSAGPASRSNEWWTRQCTVSQRLRRHCRWMS